MTSAEKGVFIDDLCQSSRLSIKEQVPLMPDSWDGHELRQFIADWFAEQSYTLKRDRKRYTAYKNTVAIMGRR